MTGPSAAEPLTADRAAIGQLGEADSVRSLAFERPQVASAGRLGRRRLKLATNGEIFRLKPPFEFSICKQPSWLIMRGAKTVADSAVAVP